eukprot:3872_1
MTSSNQKIEEKHDNDNDYEEELNTTPVTIAFAEEIEDERYYFRSFLPSKIGGKPAWLNPKKIPKYSHLKCKQCKKPLKFLLQIYAPLEQFSRSHHRIIYIFICSQHECCGKPGTLKVLRSQLPSQNPFYENHDNKTDNYDSEAENQIQKKEDLLLSKLSKFTLLRIEPYENIPNCIVCGIYGSFKCGACKNPLINYCSKEHQKYHWFTQHRKFCKDLKILESEKQLYECLKDYYFPIFEIVPDMEPKALTVDINKIKIESDFETQKIKKLMKKYKKTGGDSGYDENDLKLLEEQMAKDFDGYYLKFQERIHRAPAQIIRYADGGNVCVEEHDEKNDDVEKRNEWPEPLWMGRHGRIDCIKDVPKCNECGGERQFEFQIMPQLLHILKQGVKDLDWGILAVFSCVNSCGNGEEKYFEEFVHYQISYGAFENRDNDGFIG